MLTELLQTVESDYATLRFSGSAETPFRVFL